MTVYDLSKFTDAELADTARERERAYQDSLAEIERRRTDRLQPEWTQKSAMAAIARKRAEPLWHPRPTEGYPTDLPPELFRIGYEWAALSMVALLERILSRPSSDCYEVAAFEKVGTKDLYRIVGKPQVEDKRRRAALDLIEMLESYFTDSHLLFVMPQRRSAYRPEDDNAEARSR